MGDKETVDYIVHALRHEPDRLDLSLSDHGWVTLSEVLSGMESYLEDEPDDVLDLSNLLEEHSNGRLEFDEGRVRAMEGHTADDVSYSFQEPPETLYYAVASERRGRILIEGRERTDGGFIKLHETKEGALDERPGLKKPSLVSIRSKEAWFDGTVFYRHRGDWYMKGVEGKYLEKEEKDADL